MEEEEGKTRRWFEHKFENIIQYNIPYSPLYSICYDSSTSGWVLIRKGF